MLAMLEPILGETGALVAQFVITLAVVLLLLLVVVWLVRRYSRGALAGSGRGRLPRLAIVDAMAVDSRRKLVLVRRDNVEHLILIGGPSDLVVEPGIMRQRTAAGQRQGAAQQVPSPQQPATAQQAAAPQQAPAAAEAASTDEPLQPTPPPRPAAPALTPPPPPTAPASRGRADAVGADQPIPFPPRRSPVGGRAGWLRRDSPRPERSEPEEPRAPRPLTASAAAGVDLEGARTSRPMSASARFEEMARPTAIKPSFSLIDEAETEPELPPPLDPEEFEAGAAPGLADGPRDVAAEFAVPDSELGESPRPTELRAAVPLPSEEPSAHPEHPEPSVKVSDLEKEMARLLGEISTSRSS